MAHQEKFTATKRYNRLLHLLNSCWVWCFVF